MLSDVPSDFKAYIKGRYFVAYFPKKILKKEFFSFDLKDSEFSNFQVENFDNSSQIVITCKRGFVPKFSKNGDKIVIKALPFVATKTEELNLSAVPKDMIALPFYVSENTFSPVKNIKPSYDETLFFSGIRAFYINNYQLAAAFFKEIITKYPQSHFFISAYFLLGDCYKKMKQYNLAISTYNKAIQLAPKNDAVAQTLFSIADIYQKQDMFMAARQIYKKIKKDYAGTVWAFKANFMLGYSYYKENRCRQALKYFLNIQKKNSYYPLSMLLSAECFYRKKDYARSVLAYYYMSSELNSIDVKKFYKELGDVGIALCEFEDYKESDKVFSYLESSKDNNIVEFSYIERMRCDLKKGDYDDLDYRGKYILKFSKNAKYRELARKLMDEAKLKKGQVSKKMIDEIMAKYKNDPEVVSLALYVYAEKNYRDKNCPEALDYLAKLKKMYPNSEYNKKSDSIASECINRMVDDFYKNPDIETIEKAYDFAVLLKPQKADLCKLSWGMIFSGKVGSVEKIMHQIKDEECKDTVIAKFYVEMGNDVKAAGIVNKLSKTKPYVYYIDMIFGDINYFNNDYNKAYELYKNGLGIDVPIMQDYLRLRIAKSLLESDNCSSALNYLKRIKTRMYNDEVEFLKGRCLFKLKKYKDAIETLLNLRNNLAYREKVLFYVALSYLNLNDKKSANEFYLKLKRYYPNSQYLKVLESLM
ncbi:tetratricopeptide repeat protein [Hippea alviniae]|uniref:tetratricopeptide repeat protein n=1 Tax=Hippea alviniae TaxID=1279027 RepID=UPI0003B43057|nr:tetratricopeptide repeat protein [Hippea alviniae]